MTGAEGSWPGPEASTASSPYHVLNPLTKLTAAITTSLAVIALGGVIGPLALVLLAVLLPAAVAGVLGALLRASLILSLPIAVSAVIVNLFFRPGGELLFSLGPLTATVEGMALAVEIVIRILALSGAIALFYLTTRPAELVADLERRGVSPRLAFVAHASVQTVPAMVERAGAILAAQRARGLDTEGGALRRLRGLLPLVGPTVLGTIAEVEERTLALEARGFSRPGRRTLLWWPADRPAERLLRWAAVLGLLGLIGGRILGLL